MRFMYYAEYLREGETFLFREGRTRGFGQIVKLDSLPPPDLPPITAVPTPRIQTCILTIVGISRYIQGF